MNTIKFAPIVNKLFLAFILLISLISLRSRYTTLFDLSYSDILVLGVFVILFPLIFMKHMRSQSAKQVYALFTFILCYAFATTLWVTFKVDYWYILYQLLLTGLTVTIPYLTSTIANDKHINSNQLLTNFSIVLTLVFLYYITQQIPGERLDGYLGGAALIHAIMIPVIAVFLNNIMHKQRVLISLIGTFITMSALFLSESRAGLLALILFALLTILRRISVKRIMAVLLPLILFIPIILSFASTDRYSRGFEDPARTENLKTGMRFATQSIGTFLFGNGYGSIWNWYAYQMGILTSWAFPVELTKFGYIMVHPHSVFVGLFAELGVIGTLPFLAILVVIIREFWRSNKAKNELRTNILGAIICTFPTLHTDIFFFRNWEISIVWLFFVFTALCLPLELSPYSSTTCVDKKTTC